MTLTDFFKRSFCDAKGTPDGKLLTLFGLSGMVLASFPIGWIWGRWLPDTVLSTTYLFLAAGFGIDAYVTGSKIQADAAVQTATVTGQQPSAAASATTTTTTTIEPAGPNIP